MTKTNAFRRRAAILVGLMATACTGAAQAATYTMYRDPGCGCCMAWTAHTRAQLSLEVKVREDVPMASVKSQLGVPAMLASCHTAVIEGYVVEGHVPAREIARLLTERPGDIEGLAVAGMPLGSPGMEAGGGTQPFQVIAFGSFGQRVYADYP